MTAHLKTFTRRTNDPKLAWIEWHLDDAGITHERSGESFHAPILLVDAARLEACWSALRLIDDIDDDDVCWLAHDCGCVSHPDGVAQCLDCQFVAALTTRTS